MAIMNVVRNFYGFKVDLSAVGFALLTSDPTDPPEGTAWYNTTEGALKIRNSSINLTLLSSGTMGSIRARLATAAVLAACTYANGTAGVGATLTLNAAGALSVDGVAVALSDYILVKDQVSGAQNGLYKVTTLGTALVAAVLTRAVEFDTADEIHDGVVFNIGEGTANADRSYRLTTNGTIIVGTTALTFARESDVALLGTAQSFTALKTFSAGITLASGQKLLAGTNEIIGTVTAKINPVHIAHASQAVGDLLYADAATTMARLADVAVGSYLRSGGVGAAPLWSTLVLPNAATQGDLLTATSANTVGSIVAGAAGVILRGAGAGTVPAWSTATYPTDVSAIGGLLYASGAHAYGELADVAVGQVLVSGGVGVAPAYSATPSVTTVTGTTSLLSPKHDVALAGALSIGVDTATSLEVSKSGVQTNINGPLVLDEGLSVSGAVTFNGSVQALGAKFLEQATQTFVSDRFMDLDAGYRTAAARTTGFDFVYLPTATVDTIAAPGFTEGNGGADATIKTTGAATFAATDLVQVSGTTNGTNDGIYEVLTHAANLLTLKGMLTPCVEAWTQTNVTTSTSTVGALVKVGVAVLQVGTDGKIESGAGNQSGIAYVDLARATVATSSETPAVSGTVTSGATTGTVTSGATTGTVTSGATTGTVTSGATTGTVTSGACTVGGNTDSASAPTLTTESILAPAAAAVAVHAQIFSDTAPPVTTAITNPVVPRNLIVAGGATWDGGAVTIVGTDQDNAAVTEIFPDPVGATKTGVSIFKTVTSISYTAGTGGGTKTIDITTGDKLGITAAFSVGIELCNGVQDLGVFDYTTHQRGFTPVLVANAARNYTVMVASTSSHTHTVGAVTASLTSTATTGTLTSTATTGTLTSTATTGTLTSTALTGTVAGHTHTQNS